LREKKNNQVSKLKSNSIQNLKKINNTFFINSSKKNNINLSHSNDIGSNMDLACPFNV